MATQFSEQVVKKALRTKSRVKKIDANHYLVSPPGATNDCTSENAEYILAYTLDKSGAVTIESCRDSLTNSQCKGFRFSGGHGSGCYHGATVAIHVLKPILTVKLRHTTPAARKR